MDKIKFYQVSSLEKVYLNYELPENEFCAYSALKNERISYQIAYRGTEPYQRPMVSFKVCSPLAKAVSIRAVGNIPSECPITTNCDEHFEKYEPGLFPDVLYPMEENIIEVSSFAWHSLWITVDLDGTFDAGLYPIDIVFSEGDKSVCKSFTLEIINASLPEQEMLFTQWFHADCIADYYNVSVFSKKHWELIESFIATASKNGINMLLTPIFTPPLDTQIGGERTTVQLVEIKKVGEKYSFDFTKLKKWIKICKKHGIKYFEMAHLFTQWGLKATPKIIATVGGEKKRIFGWDVASDSKEYENFLSQFLPQLSNLLKKEKIAENTFFHLSDEPLGEEHQMRYLALKKLVKRFIPEYTIMDALSEYEFYEKGITDLPIPSSDHIEKFIENKVSNLWTYYCCAQSVGVSNRFFAMPSYRNRIIGTQFYKFDIKGFLHWGYNFYNSKLSRSKINPFVVTDAKNGFPSGDSFSVYPGKDGPLESLRIIVFAEALQDVRAFKLLETFIGKDEVVKLIENQAEMEIKFDSYPHTSKYLLTLRQTVNEKIKEFCK